MRQAEEDKPEDQGDRSDKENEANHESGKNMLGDEEDQDVIF